MVDVASSSGNEPQFFCSIINVDYEIVADVSHAIHGFFVVKYGPSVVLLDVIEARPWSLIYPQIVPSPPRLGVGEPDNLCTGEPWLVRHGSAAGHGHEEQKE